MPRKCATNRYGIPSVTPIESQLLWNDAGLSEDYILPEQVFAPVQVQSKHRGEVALLYAVLGDAIRCFLGKHGKSQRGRSRIIQDAEIWLFDDDEQWPFSFTNVCEMLDLSPTWVRQQLRNRQGVGALTSFFP